MNMLKGFINFIILGFYSCYGFEVESANRFIDHPNVEKRYTFGAYFIAPTQTDPNCYYDLPLGTDACVAEIVKPSESKKEILEIGPGMAFLIARILGTQAKHQEAPSLHYSIVESNERNLNHSKEMFESRTQEKFANSFSSFYGSSDDYFKNIKPENVFDVVAAFMVPHFWNPISFIQQIAAIHKSLKAGGLFCFTVKAAKFDLTGQSFYYPHSYKVNVNAGNPLSFWILDEQKMYADFVADPVSMRHVMSSLGFEIETCKLVMDINPMDRRAFNYLSVIARKAFITSSKVNELYKFAESTLHTLIDQLLGSLRLSRKEAQIEYLGEDALEDEREELVKLYKALYKAKTKKTLP